MVAETHDPYATNLRSLLGAVEERGERDAVAAARRAVRSGRDLAREAERQRVERELERDNSMNVYLVGSLDWQERERARYVEDHGVYTLERAIKDAYRELWSLSDSITKINDDEESETGKQLHMRITNVADLEFGYRSIPSAKMRLVWDWCVIGREQVYEGGGYTFRYFLERTPPRMVKGRQRPIFRCNTRSPLAAAKGLRAMEIPATVPDVEGWLEYGMASVIATLCHEGVLSKDGHRPGEGYRGAEG